MPNYCYLAVALLHGGSEGKNAVQRWQKYSCQSPFNSDMGKKVIPENHIKRPMNAFMAWSKRERRKMVEEGTNLNNSVMSRILGERWKQLSEEEKKTWKRTAEKLKKEHAKVKPLFYQLGHCTGVQSFWHCWPLFRTGFHCCFLHKLMPSCPGITGYSSSGTWRSFKRNFHL